MKLLLVEKPAHVQRLRPLLGKGWAVDALTGWARDLPADRLGITISQDFALTREPRAGARHGLRRLRQSLAETTAVYVALTGAAAGAAAWDWLDAAPLPERLPVFGLPLHSLTAEGVRAGLEAAYPLSRHPFEAALTRRTVNRLTGYLLAPPVRRMLGTASALVPLEAVCLHQLMASSAGRTDPVYRLKVVLALGEHTFTAELARVKGQTAPFRTRAGLEKLAALLERSPCWVEAVTTGMESIAPPLPLTVLSLIGRASSSLGLPPARTLAVADALYDGGWITCPWTNAGSPDAAAAAHALIRCAYGERYVSQSEAQAATPDAIRTTDATRLPEDGGGDGNALYRLVWRHCLGTHLPPAEYRRTAVQIGAGQSPAQPYPIQLVFEGRVLAFDGFLRLDAVLPETEREALILPREGDGLRVVETQLIEEAPPACTAADLVAVVCGAGAAQPWAVSAALDALGAKRWVREDGGRLTVTSAGEAVHTFLQRYLPSLTALEQGAAFETEVAHVVQGETTRAAVLGAFWATFEPALKRATRASLRRRPPCKERQATPVLLRPIEEGNR